MTIYMPTYQRQSAASGDPTWKYDCTAFCLAMLIDAATLGGTVVSARWVRLNSDEPVPDPKSPGLNIRQVDVVAAKLHVLFEDRQGHSWAELLVALREGRRVLAQIDYASLGQQRCQSNGDFGHAMLLHNLGATAASIRATDPLCPAPKVYGSTIIQRSMTKFARDTGVQTGLRYAVSRKVPEIV
jgi:hypothetical protein